MRVTAPRTILSQFREPCLVSINSKASSLHAIACFSPNYILRKRGGEVQPFWLAQIFTEPQCQRMYSNACPYPNDTSTPEPAKHYRLIHSDRSQVRALLFFVFIATALRRMFD